MNGPTHIRDSGEHVVIESVDRFVDREADNLTQKNVEAIYRGAGQLDELYGDKSPNGLIELPLKLISPLREDEKKGGITDHVGANDVAERILLNLHRQFSGTDSKNIIQDRDNPNIFSWIAYFYNGGKEIQLIVLEKRPPELIDGQPVLFGYSARAILAPAGSRQAQELRASLQNRNHYKRLLREIKLRAFGTRGKE